MTRANDIASLVDSAGDIVAAALDNVAPSNDASALTTGTLAAARLPTTGVDASSLSTGTLAAARLPSSGISASAVDTGTLPNLSLLPSGSIVKVDMIQGRAANTQVANNTTSYATDFTVTYDVVSGGNKLIILMNYSHFGDVDNDSHTSKSAQIKMQISSNGGSSYSDIFVSGNSLLDRGGQSRFRTSDFMREYNIPSSPTNGQILLRMQGRRVSGTRSYNMGGQVGSHVTFIEVAS